MKEFRYLIKVDRSDPMKAVKQLGQLVVGKEDAFQNVDMNFIANQEFITAVPIEIALTVPMRSQVLYNVPECRFILTGVPSFRIKNLIECGYGVFRDQRTTKPENEKPDSVENGITPPPTLHVHLPEKEYTEKDIPGEGEVGDTCDEVEPVLKYYLNGQEISREEFESKIETLKLKIETLKEEFDRCFTDNA